jgi:hypothetical protein
MPWGRCLVPGLSVSGEAGSSPRCCRTRLVRGQTPGRLAWVAVSGLGASAPLKITQLLSNCGTWVSGGLQVVGAEGIEPSKAPLDNAAIIGKEGQPGPSENLQGPPEQSNRSQTADPELFRLSALWPNLPQGVRSSILTLAASVVPNASPEAGNVRINPDLEPT